MLLDIYAHFQNKYITDTYTSYLYSQTIKSLREGTMSYPPSWGYKRWKKDSTSMDTALFLALTLWISSMNKLCMVEPFMGACGH